MAPKLDLDDYKIKILEYGGESIKLKSLISQAVIKGFLAKPAVEINSEIMDPILWHTKNIIILKSTLQQCGKNIITDFIGDKTGMSSGEWHKFNGHLKSLIMEGMVSIERKGIETKRIRDFTGFMQLGKVLDHPDVPGVVMRYLLSRDLSDFEPQEIPKYLEWCGENGEKPFSNNIARKKFSDIATDIPIFNVPETISQKIIPPQTKMSTPLPSTKKDKKANKQDDSTQALFDYMSEDTRAPVASISGTSETSKRPELVIDEPETSKSLKPIKSNPDVFVTITEKDIKLSHEYQDRMMSDADAIDFAKEDGMDVIDIFYMSRRERLISKEIYLCNHEDIGKPRAYVYDDEEWQKGWIGSQEVNICQVFFDNTCSDETIKETAQRIVRDNLSERDERSEQHENEGIDFPDHFSLESVRERLDEYNISNMPDKQEAISSRQLRDSEKPGSTYLSTFLKKDEFIPKTESRKPLLPSSLRKFRSVFASVAYGLKNPSKANTYASEALRHSPDNHASPSKRYTIVNMQKRGEPYNQAEPFCIFDEN
ncbi:hypothetical protein C1646_775563 [Rhizophagus diaphanus]|nr:hypothetical protein C1646_775563 [Rhizophagus diaphanus] [Rhizophagus sp. MUCL 43196]